LELSAEAWAKQQWGTVRLGDRRRTERAVEMGMRMAAHPEASLPTQMGSKGALKGAYRLLNHAEVTLEALTESHREQTLAAAGQQMIVLMAEDTTELDYTYHRSKTGLGPIGDGKGKGLLLHSTLAITPGTRQILGLAHVQVVLRVATPEKPQRKWARSPEGLLWDASAEAVGQPPAGVMWMHVSDRGSDVFTYMAICVESGKHFLIRAQLNRLLTWEEDSPEASDPAARALMDYARSLPIVPESVYEQHVPKRGKWAAREAQVGLGWAKVTISPPAQAPREVRQHQSFEAWVLRVSEIDPPPDVEPLEWILLVSMPIQSVADARRMMDWYTCRWLCEDYHQCLKTGCQIEHSQLDDGADIQRLLGFSAPIAVRLLQLRQAVRVTPDTPAIELIDPLMVRVLSHLRKLDLHMSIQTFWRQVAQLGGHQGRKSDGPPGWRTLWHGWRYLSDLTQGAQLYASFNPPSNSS